MSGRLVLVRHGQSYGNVERRLDTRPPGAALTPLGFTQAREFARRRTQPTALVRHSIALRASQTAGEIGAELGLPVAALDGIYEAQVGDLENRCDDDALAQFDAVHRQWLAGDLDVAPPGGESGRQVLDRYLPAISDLRMRHLDDGHWTGDIVVVSHGAAIRLVATVLAGVDGGFAVEHHLGNAEAVILTPITDGRWSCVQWGEVTPPFQGALDATGGELESADPTG